MVKPGDEIAAARGPDQGHGRLRACHSDREQVAGALRVAFVEGRLTDDEFGARIDQVYASRTYSELAAIVADLPTALTGPRSRRAPWRATKTVWWFEYAVLLPGIVAVIVLPGGPDTTIWTLAVFAAAIYPGFWTLGVVKMAGSRRGKPSGMQPLPRSRYEVRGMLQTAQAQGRLSEDELDERTAQVPPAATVWPRAEQDALLADLPDDISARLPTAREAWAGVGVCAVAAGALTTLMLLQPDSFLAFATALLCAATVLLAPPITVGLVVDARHQKRFGRHLRLGSATSTSG